MKLQGLQQADLLRSHRRGILCTETPQSVQRVHEGSRTLEGYSTRRWCSVGPLCRRRYARRRSGRCLECTLFPIRPLRRLRMQSIMVDVCVGRRAEKKITVVGSLTMIPLSGNGAKSLFGLLGGEECMMHQ